MLRSFRSLLVPFIVPSFFSFSSFVFIITICFLNTLTCFKPPLSPFAWGDFTGAKETRADFSTSQVGVANVILVVKGEAK